MSDEGFFGGKVRSIPINCYEDERGLLAPIDFPAYGFVVARAFVVKGREGAVRGEHGHKRGRQILMLVSGEIDVELRWRGQVERIGLNSANRALLIEPPVWSRQFYRDQRSSMVVFCDTPYDPQDYVREIEG